MEPKPVNQKEFIIHSDQNHEWIYNGKDRIGIYFKSGFNTCKTIHWRGITFHVRIIAPESNSRSRIVCYSTIFNGRIYYRKLTVAHGGGCTRGDKPPVIETDKYYLEILFGYQSFMLTEKVKQNTVLENEIKPAETASAVSEKENKSKETASTVFEEEKRPIKFSDTLKKLFTKKQLSEKIKPVKAESKKSEPEQTDSEIEDTLFRVCPFMVVNASEDIKFDFPERKKDPITIQTEQVTLYENNNNPSVYVNSYAYFEKNHLVVDFWKLGYSYEDEEFIVVNERFVPLVYKEFNIKTENKFQLLIGILNAFSGKGCFQKYEEFLNSKKIPHGFRVRHDDAMGG